MPSAATLSCPQCGAAASSEASECAYCHARLATVACPSCFGMIFVGSRHCQHCGAAAVAPAMLDGRVRQCPSGCGALTAIALGGATLGECTQCGGLWVDEATFQRVGADSERQAAIVTFTHGSPPVAPSRTAAYRPCPECGKLMNRMNYARVSGVIIDACRGHGVWCDEDELRRVVEFIRDGGLDVARRREREALADERRLLEFKRRETSVGDSDSKQYGVAAKTMLPSLGSLFATLLK
jgi:Zn-finger nucleic acid-binding protein